MHCLPLCVPTLFLFVFFDRLFTKFSPEWLVYRCFNSKKESERTNGQHERVKELTKAQLALPYFFLPFQLNIDLRWGQSGDSSVYVDSEKKKSREGWGSPLFFLVRVNGLVAPLFSLHAKGMVRGYECMVCMCVLFSLSVHSQTSVYQATTILLNANGHEKEKRVETAKVTL